MSNAGSLEPATERFRRHVGPVAERRPAPSLARAVAAAGALLAGAGVVGVGVDVLSDGGPRGVAVAVAAAYGLGGAALLARAPEPLRTAGVAAVTSAVFLFWAFVVFGRGELSPGRPGLVLALSTVAWGTLVLAGPTRGHAALVGATLAGAWLTVAVRLGVDALVATADVATGADPAAASTSVGVASLVFGAAYLAAGDALDRAGLAGTATPFLAVTVAALATGVVHAGGDHGRDVQGALLLAAGAAVAAVGGGLGRRASTWTGAAAAVTGAAVVVRTSLAGHLLAQSLAAAAVGAAVVALAPALARVGRSAS